MIHLFKKKKSKHTAKYKNSSKRNHVMTQQERRQCVGNGLSFAASEAYKLLRTNLTFSLSDESDCKIIGVTSALPYEGKSTTAVNLAFSMSKSNKKVLLIDADMRFPNVGKLLGINDSLGLSNVLAGVNQLNEVVGTSPLSDNLHVLPAGIIPPNPNELLSSIKMNTIIMELSKVFNYIIIDLPPINVVSDGLAISKLLSGVVMVVRRNYCDQYSLSKAMEKMDFLKVKILGFVFNDSNSNDFKNKKYGSYDKKGYNYQHKNI